MLRLRITSGCSLSFAGRTSTPRRRYQPGLLLISETRDDRVIEVRVNCPDATSARAIADAVVSERLAAAANIHAPIESRYHWKGRIEKAAEVPLVLKTRRALFDELAVRITALHPYETPSIIGVEMSAVSARYRDWVIDETTR